MRKLYKNMIFELLETLRTAASEAKNLFTKKDTDTLINLLADCQDCANQIGELVAEFEGAEHITISYLREYCELLYKISLESDKTDSDIDIKKELRKQLSKIRNSVENDIKTTIEIVFFPYMASMFDSLESIWLTAKDDPDCDAYVVPIPYYDRNPDYSFGKMHYEGGEYPDYVPVVDWRKYNVEERRPDVIFVHNPYDGGNYVTSVHPDFYSKRLREFTGCLCYVPYFVTANDFLDEHFATTAGCVYAHKVFVQSDMVRDLYIEYFKKNFGNKYGKAEDKFFALGSPKFDKVLNTKRADCKIPEEWRRLIEKPDGTSKKVVFYNTSLAAVLQDSEQYLKKLRHVLSVFKERDDVVLWWRPHPLMDQTFDSMRPQLAKEYRGVVLRYRQDGFGIYDNTADLHRAIAWSDGYYGDGSSLVAMYNATDKPLMMQNIEIISNRHEGITFLTYFNSERDEILCLNYFGSISALSTIDAATLTVRQCYDYPTYEDKFVPLISSYVALKIGSKVYFAPRFWVNGNHIAIYDDNTKSFEYIPIKWAKDILLDTNVTNSPKFQRVIHYNNSVYFFPSSYPAVVRLDLNTKAITYYSDFVDKVLSITAQTGRKNGYAFYMTEQIENKVYISCRWAGVIVEFDLDNHRIEIIRPSGLQGGNNLITPEGNHVWIFAEAGQIIRLNRSTKETELSNKLSQELAKKTKSALFAIFNGFIYIPIFNDDKLPLKTSMISGETSVADELVDLMEKDEHITSFATHKNNLYFATDKSRIFEISDFNQKPRIGNITFPSDETNRLRANLCAYHRDRIVPNISEYDGMVLEKYVDTIICGELDNRIPAERLRDCGEAIYSYMKSEILKGLI